MTNINLAANFGRQQNNILSSLNFNNDWLSQTWMKVNYPTSKFLNHSYGSCIYIAYIYNIKCKWKGTSGGAVMIEVTFEDDNLKEFTFFRQKSKTT